MLMRKTYFKVMMTAMITTIPTMKRQTITAIVAKALMILMTTKSIMMTRKTTMKPIGFNTCSFILKTVNNIQKI